MNVWLLQPFEPLPADRFPVMRYRQLARELGNRSHHVTWWASDFLHVLKRRRQVRHEPNADEPYTVRALHPPAYRSNRSPVRVASHLAMAAQAVWRFRGKAPPHLVVASWGPVELAAVAVAFGARHGVPVCIDVLDPWPDSFETVLPASVRGAAPFLLWPHRRLSRWALRNATALTAVSEGFLDWARESRCRAPELPTDVFLPGASDRSLRAPRAIHSPLRLLFAGTIGHMYDFDLMLDAAELLHLRRPEEVVFEFAGTGPRLSELRSRPPPPNVHLHGLLRDIELDRLAAGCDIGLCCFPPFAPTTLTSKLFFYLSYGLPILGTPQLEMARMLEERGLGLTVRTAQELAAVVESFLEAHSAWNDLAEGAYRYALAHSLEREMSSMADFLERIVGRQGAFARRAPY